MSVVKPQYSPSHTYPSAQIDFRATQIKELKHKINTHIDKLDTNIEKLEQRIDIFSSRMMSSVNETLKAVNQESALCRPMTTSASSSASTTSSFSTSISTAPLTPSKDTDLLITVQRSSEDTPTLEYRNTRSLLSRANALMDAVLPLISDNSRLQDASKLLTSTFNNKINFRSGIAFDIPQSEMTIGQRVYFHLYLILSIETPRAIKADDPNYVAKAFANQDGCRSTLDQRRLALERTCVEMAIESINEINAKYKPTDNPEIENLPQNVRQFNEYYSDIREHINFLDSIKMTVYGDKIGSFFITRTQISSIYRARTTHCVKKCEYEGAIFPFMQQLLCSWKYIT